MSALDLHYRAYGQGDKTLLILHGLLGSSQNWQRAARALGEKFRVLVVDQRNHGESPHAATHTLAELRTDLERFLDQQGLAQVYLLGHSMGGLVAMEFAFHHPERLSGLLVEDIAPRAHAGSSAGILEALAALSLEGLQSRQQAEAALAAHIPDPGTRQFVLTNLVRTAEGSFAWRVNLPALQAFQRELAAYAAPLYARHEGETLFIGGERSPYHLDQDLPLLQSHFPRSHLVMIPNAGHWVHFEALPPFQEVVTRFLEHGLAGFGEHG